MEAVSMIGASQVKFGATDSLKHRGLGFLRNNWLSSKSRICICHSSNFSRNCGIRLTLKASSKTGAVQKALEDPSSSSVRRCKSVGGVRLFVGLPLDTVSDCNTVNHARAIVAGLKALKLMGVDGVELPVWWGAVEKDAMGKYEWAGYLAIAELVQNMGLKLHVSLCFHACREPKIPLPDWVSRIGISQPNIFFTDRSGEQYKECLSLAVDELPVLDGKTPMQVYQDFCESFKLKFAPFMGSTISGISMGLGPDGELRYPVNHRSAKSSNTPGVGEFQCYDKNMLSHLEQHAKAAGNPLWGLGGPHDAPSYDQPPNTSNFFKEQGGSWETPYGDFFLSWYSGQLTSHGDRLLSLASSIFHDSPVTVSGKIPLMHSWYRTRAHPSELTAGFYNTANRDGYEAVANIFAKNSCRMILPGMDLLDEHQTQGSSPQSLLAQIKEACRKHGVKVSGQNTSISGRSSSLDQIKRNLTEDDGMVDLFTYQRMGTSFFSPKHFPLFMGFVRGLSQPDPHPDDLVEEDMEAVPTGSEVGRDLQVA
ncbi:beta-amylase [Ancistrocladus abbreviatus]